MSDQLTVLAKRVRDLTEMFQNTPILLGYAGSPDGLLTAREGTMCWDLTGHNLYVNISPTEGITWTRLGHEWIRYQADSLTLGAGTSADALSDLQTPRDGNFYHIDEAAGAPGINLIVDFVDVATIEFAEVNASYEGSTTHAIAVQLYNWTTASWDTFDAIQTGVADVTTANGYIVGNHSFNVHEPDNYIGTGANEGRVRVRLYHTMNGNAAHDLYVDDVALYG